MSKQFLDVPGGDPITYVTVTEDGYRLYPFFPNDEETQKNFEDIPNKRCRDDDILLNSYPRTGTNWVWEMMTMVLNRSPNVTDGLKGPGMLECNSAVVHEALPSPRILNTHVKFRYIPKEALKKKLKTVLLCRNPKDAVVSYYIHTKNMSLYEYDGKFENYLAMYMRGEVDFGSYPEYLSEWQQGIRDHPDWKIHVIHYEDLKENCFQEMRKLCEYLGQDIEDDLLREIIDNCEIDKFRKAKENNVSDELKKLYQTITKNNYRLWRKGLVGDWKNWLTVAQNEKFDKWWTDNTKELDMFKFRYTLN